jgi:hypothetical protein
VRDEEVGQFPFGAQAAHELEDPGLHGDVERAGRLVREEHFGAQREGERDRPAARWGGVARKPGRFP